MNCRRCGNEMSFDDGQRAYLCTCGNRIDRGGVEKKGRLVVRLVGLAELVISLVILVLAGAKTFIVGDETPLYFLVLLAIFGCAALHGLWNLVKPIRE